MPDSARLRSIEHCTIKLRDRNLMPLIDKSKYPFLSVPSASRRNSGKLILHFSSLIQYNDSNSKCATVSHILGK